uniref:PLOD1-3-like GT domain-containing protein n=1 Tax=Elaeophora elaphi TaxID=1147741 RepID=A0A0R3RUB8_9BILA
MCLLLFSLLLLISSSLSEKCDSSAYKLAIFALDNGNNDALERLKCSAGRYNIDFKILNLGKSSINQHENGKNAGKILKTLAEKLEKFRMSNSTVVLIIDGFDAIITSDESNIICQFLNACSNCRALLTPKMVTSKRLVYIIEYIQCIFP